MDYPLDPKAELMKWGPVPMYEYFGDIFPGLITGFEREYGYIWPTALVLYKDGRMIWIEDEKAVWKEGGRLFMDRIFPRNVREEDEAKWVRVRDVLVAEEERINAIDLTSLSTEDLRAAWNSFHAKLVDFWTHSTATEFANYGSMPILKAEIAETVPESELGSVMETLTAPEEFSFYQREEIELSRTNDIGGHQKKYFWISNSYSHVEVVPVEKFAERKAELPVDLETKAMQRIADVKQKKSEVITQYGLSDRAVKIAEGICRALSLQDDRKEGIWRFIHTAHMLLKEAARRYNFSYDDARFFFVHEIEALMDGGTLDFEERKRGHGLLIEGDVLTPLDTATTEKYWKAFADVEIVSDVSEVKGTVASKGAGIVRGTARLIRDPKHASQFAAGDILVTEMTTPDYVHLMKIAGAIVTDTGGLMSHAAVVSREFGVACIVGTKIATGVFKDGDTIEVDTSKGTARKI